jgi:hypothetical protein
MATWGGPCCCLQGGGDSVCCVQRGGAIDEAHGQVDQLTRTENGGHFGNQ